uniref:Uncharacterized protein n=1 Tax=Pseudomonas phage HRDY3 TaxID=3236930 RepID=A0AB39CDB3_9VIRU
MGLLVYASRSEAAFAGVRATDIHRYGDFFVAAVPRRLSGDFDIIATVDDGSFTIELNKVMISYDDMADLLENATHH